MGKKLAHEINATKYLECSSSNEMEIADIFEQTVWSFLRQAEQRIHTKYFKEKNKKFFFFCKNLF